MSSATVLFIVSHRTAFVSIRKRWEKFKFAFTKKCKRIVCIIFYLSYFHEDAKIHAIRRDKMLYVTRDIIVKSIRRGEIANKFVCKYRDADWTRRHSPIDRWSTVVHISSAHILFRYVSRKRDRWRRKEDPIVNCPPLLIVYEHQARCFHLWC